MKTIKLTYYIKSKVEIGFDESGDLVLLEIDDRNCIENGDSIDHVLCAINDAGHDLQEDISNAFIKLESELAYG